MNLGDLFTTNPKDLQLLNNGVAFVKDVVTAEELQTLRFEPERVGDRRAVQERGHLIPIRFRNDSTHGDAQSAAEATGPRAGESPYHLIGPDGDVAKDITSSDEKRQRIQALLTQWFRMENVVVLLGAGASVPEDGLVMSALEEAVFRDSSGVLRDPAPAESRH